MTVVDSPLNGAAGGLDSPDHLADRRAEKTTSVTPVQSRDSRASRLGGRRVGRRRRAHAPNTDPDAEVDRTLNLVRQSRILAVWLTAGIAVVSFVLSFAALRDLAAMSAWPGSLSVGFPVIVDGTIVLATIGIVALAPYREQAWNRAFVWSVLATAALVSVGCNALHAWLITEHLPGWMRAGSAGLACVPPAALLATTHILAILWRFHPAPPPDASMRAQVSALSIAAQRVDRWAAAAALIHERGMLRTQPSAKVAAVLRYLYDHRPALTLRKIGGQPDVQLHHDVVGRIRDAAQDVLGLAEPGQRGATGSDV